MRAMVVETELRPGPMTRSVPGAARRNAWLAEAASLRGIVCRPGTGASTRAMSFAVEMSCSQVTSRATASDPTAARGEGIHGGGPAPPVPQTKYMPREKVDYAKLKKTDKMAAELAAAVRVQAAWRGKLTREELYWEMMGYY